MPVTTTTPGIQLKPGWQSRLAAGSWRVDPAHSHASFAARAAARPVRDPLRLTWALLITEPVDTGTWPPRHDDVLIFPRTGHVSGRRRRGRLGDGRLRADPRPAGGLPRRSRRCR